MPSFPEPIDRLIAELRKLPSIGAKTAQRLVFHLVGRPPDQIRALASAVEGLCDGVRPCSRCHQITDIDPCRICTDPARDPHLLCVVEQPADVLAVEESGEYRGRYHVLGGALDPLAGIGPESLNIDSLERNLADGETREVILATNAGVEGEATATYLAGRLAREGLRISRPAQGLPVGGELGYTDRLTLAQALRGRHALD